MNYDLGGGGIVGKLLEGYREQQNIKCCAGCSFVAVDTDQDDWQCINKKNLKDIGEKWMDISWNGICPRFKA